MSNKAVRIKRHSYIDQRKWERLLEENLVPISDESLDNMPDIETYFEKGDWLIEYSDSSKPVYAYRVKSYRHEPHLHLYVKHFVEVDITYDISNNILSDGNRASLASAEHLESQPQSLLDTLNNYHDNMSINLDERLAQLILILKLRRNVLTPLGKIVLSRIESEKLNVTELKETLINTPLETIKSVTEKFINMPDNSLNETQIAQKIYDIQWAHREEILFNMQVYDDYVKNNYKNPSNSKNEDVTTVTQPNDRIAYLSNEKRINIVNEALDKWYKTTDKAKMPMDFDIMSQLARKTFKQGISQAKFIDQLVQMFRKSSL